MLTNLLDNALKFTPSGGSVWVSAREIGAARPRRAVEISVGDSGTGIPEDEQEKVFERFYRGSNNEPSSTGTGLGLAIVRELMTQHGGKVTLKSKIGEGTVVSLQFPLRQSQAQNADEPPGGVPEIPAGAMQRPLEVLTGVRQRIGSQKDITAAL
jgi:signal transduction histidine kinase